MLVAVAVVVVAAAAAVVVVVVVVVEAVGEHVRAGAQAFADCCC